MIVVDASVVLEVLLATPVASQLSERLFAESETLHAPHVIDLEVLHVLRRFSLAGELDPLRGQQAVNYLAEVPLTRYSHWPLLPRIWQMRRNLTAYDAAYIALAEMLGAPLVTRDRALASAAGHSARVELI